MATLDELIVQIDASTELMRRELARGSDAVQGFADRAGGQILGFQNRLTKLTEVTRGVRDAFALLGVGISLRAFANWISDATEINKLTEEQAGIIEEEKKALGELGTSVDDLARTFATKLAPAIETAAKFWREFLFPTAGESADKRIAAINKELLDLGRAVDTGVRTRDFGFGPKNEVMSEADKQAAIRRMRELMAERAKLFATPDSQAATRGAMLKQLEDGAAELTAMAQAGDKTLKPLASMNDLLDDLTSDEKLAKLEKAAQDIQNMVPARKGQALPDFDPFKRDFEEMTRRAREFATQFAATFESRGIQALLDGDIRGAVRGLAKDFAELILRLTILEPLARSVAGWFTQSGIVTWFSGTATSNALPSVSTAGPTTIGNNARPLSLATAGGPQITQNFYIQPGPWEEQLAKTGQAAAVAAYEAVTSKLEGRR